MHKLLISRNRIFFLHLFYLQIETQSSNTPDVIVVQHPRIENHPIVVEDDLETNSRVSPIVIDVEENKDASLQSGKINEGYILFS